MEEIILDCNDAALKERLPELLSKELAFSFVLYNLTDEQEKSINCLLELILEKYGRKDLLDIVYSSTKEMIINATKSNLKRLVFKTLGLNINKDSDYREGMVFFKSFLNEKTLTEYENNFKQNNLPITVTIYFSPFVLNIKVKNNFTLLPVEEKRIRDKFGKASVYSNLFEFFTEYGDETEGAGMGLTLVGILLDQSGISKHSFVLYSSETYKETIAKIEIPLSKEYISKRQAFSREMQEKDIPALELRKGFEYNFKKFMVERKD